MPPDRISVLRLFQDSLFPETHTGGPLIELRGLSLIYFQLLIAPNLEKFSLDPKEHDVVETINRSSSRSLGSLHQNICPPGMCHELPDSEWRVGLPLPEMFDFLILCFSATFFHSFEYISRSTQHPLSSILFHRTLFWHLH